MRVLMMVVLFFCCSGDKNGLELISATRQSWVAGIRGGGAGTNYEFSCKALSSSEKLVFEGLWVENVFLPFTVSKPFPSLPADGFKKGDTIRINTTQYREVDGFRPPATEQKLPPFKYSGAALITYTLKGKAKHILVPRITKLESPQYE